MANKAPKTRMFRITGRIITDVAIEISATDIAAAIEEAKTLRIEDFITFDGEEYDGKLKIVTVGDTDYPYND